ncbi:MAG: outer membrane lipoprotein-sorting protein, partial [Burkholderiales bacterium]
MRTVDARVRSKLAWPACALGILAGFMYFLNSSAQEPIIKEEKVARDIVERADRVRFPPGGFQVDVAIANFNSGQAGDTRRYRVLSKGNENTVVMITEPAAERGQIILMKDRDLWVFLPNVSQPVRLALSQRLTGEVSNGDIARANFAGDYEPRVVRTEQIGDETFYVLELTATDRGVTYRRVMYWVNRKTFQPHKAEFYSLSNRLLKTCRYENYQKMAGAMRPTRLVMDDALRKGEQSVLDYSG